MRYFTRKEERAAVVAVLNDDTYATEDSMADAVLKAAFNAFLERAWWVTVQGTGAPFAFGLSSTENEARKLAIVAPAYVIPVSSAAAKLRDMEAS